MLRLQGIEAHASKTWTEQMIIPNSLMFSNLKHCGLITDKYVVKVIFNFSLKINYTRWPNESLVPLP